MASIGAMTRRRVEKIDVLLWLYGNACFWCDQPMTPHYAKDRAKGERRKPLDKRAMTLDELRPRAHGGHRTLRNQVLSCSTCNQRRGCQPPPAGAVERHLAVLTEHGLIALEVGGSERTRAAMLSARDNRSPEP